MDRRCPTTQAEERVAVAEGPIALAAVPMVDLWIMYCIANTLREFDSATPHTVRRGNSGVKLAP